MKKAKTSKDTVLNNRSGTSADVTGAVSQTAVHAFGVKRAFHAERRSKPEYRCQKAGVESNNQVVKFGRRNVTTVKNSCHQVTLRATKQTRARTNGKP